MIVYVLILFLDIGQTSRFHRIYNIVSHFHLFGAKKIQGIYKSDIVFLRYTVVCITFGILTIKTSKNEITDFFSISILNLILLWKLFNVVSMRFVEPTFAKRIVSFPYFFHILMLVSKRSVIVFSSYHENICWYRC